MVWLKYNHEPILLDRNVTYNQPVELSPFNKPIGFWITDDSELCWRTWCEDEDFALPSLACKHEVILDETKIPILRSVDELDAFTHRYAIKHEWIPKTYDICINWRAVARDFDGLIITPYQWDRRFDCRWYYSWDCASGCTWNVDAIKDVRLING